MSSIVLTSAEWLSIQQGESYVDDSASSYEGEEESVTWNFCDRLLTIDGEDGRQCLVDFPIEELDVQ